MQPERETEMISKIDYVKKLAAIYYAANLSDSDSEDRPVWMHGDECSIHCQAIDRIVEDMGLSEIWCNIIEGDCLDQLEEVQRDMSAPPVSARVVEDEGFRLVMKFKDGTTEALPSLGKPSMQNLKGIVDKNILKNPKRKAWVPVVSAAMKKGPVKEEVELDEKVQFEAPTKDGNTFQVIDRDTKGMAGKQDKFKMQIVDKRGKVIKDLGSHASLNGAKGMAKNRGIIEEVELDEAKYDLYHKDFSSAMQHAYKMAKKMYGITVDPKEIDDKVASGPRKPSEGKTNSYRLKGDKGAIQVQVYNKGGSKPYELNMYQEEVELDEAKQKPYVSSDRDGKHVMNASGEIAKSFKDMDSANAYLKKNYNKLMKEKLDKEDEPTVKAVVKMLKKASNAHAGQAKDLEKAVKEDSENEGFASDAQRRAAFASGYKEKGKKKKNEGAIGGLIGGAIGAATGGPVGAYKGMKIGSKVGDAASTAAKVAGAAYLAKKGYDAAGKKKKEPNNEGTINEILPALAGTAVRAAAPYVAGYALRKIVGDGKDKKKGNAAPNAPATESAASDARRAMASDPSTKQKFSKNVSATDDDVKAADKNIIMQMRKAVSLRGNKVEFMDKKKVMIPQKIAQAVITKYNNMKKPADKEKFQSKISKSYKSMLATLKEQNEINNKNNSLDQLKELVKEMKGKNNG